MVFVFCGSKDKQYQQVGNAVPPIMAKSIAEKLARKLGKRIIAIEPWGAERTSQLVKDNADQIVKWQADSIVRAIFKGTSSRNLSYSVFIFN